MPEPVSRFAWLSPYPRAQQRATAENTRSRHHTRAGAPSLGAHFRARLSDKLGKISWQEIVAEESPPSFLTNKNSCRCMAAEGLPLKPVTARPISSLRNNQAEKPGSISTMLDALTEQRYQERTLQARMGEESSCCLDIPFVGSGTSTAQKRQDVKQPSGHLHVLA